MFTVNDNLSATAYRVDTSKNNMHTLTFGPDIEKIMYHSEYSTGNVWNSGFYWLFSDAAESGHSIALSPDDILIQILSQFAVYRSYANNNQHFYEIKFDDQTNYLATLLDFINSVKIDGNPNGNLDQSMIKMLQKLPSFTTSTDIDRVSAGLALMSHPRKHLGTMLQYRKINQKFENTIKQVKIMGIADDWNKIANMLNDIVCHSSDEKIIQWINRLKPIINKFILTLELQSNYVLSDEAIALQTWWKSMISMVGKNELTGWVTDFFMFMPTYDGLIMCDKFNSNGYPIIHQNNIPHSHNCVVFKNGNAFYKVFSGKFVLDQYNAKTDLYDGLFLKSMLFVTKMNSCTPVSNDYLVSLVRNTDIVCNVCDSKFTERFPTELVSYCDKCNLFFKDKGAYFLLSGKILCDKCSHPNDSCPNDSCPNDSHPNASGKTIRLVSNVLAKPDVIANNVGTSSVSTIYKAIDKTVPFYFPKKNDDFKYVDNGFVRTMLSAYNNHHNVYLRPDDIWITILSQFCIYVTNNAEAVRTMFVSHEGVKKVTSVVVTEDDGCDMIETLLNHLSEQLKNNLNEGIMDDLIPKFSTTTNDDIFAAKIGTMAINKNYFIYEGWVMKCGIPSVTLYGTLEDWILLKKQVLNLRKFNNESDNSIEIWITLLSEILDNMIRTANGDNDKELQKWWNSACNYQSLGSYGSKLSGWITCFCMFADIEGEYKFNKPDDKWPIIDIGTNGLGIPESVMVVDLILHHYGVIKNVKLCSGVLGISKVPNDQYGIAPKVSWFINEIDEKLQRIKQLKAMHHMIHEDSIASSTFYECYKCRSNSTTYGCKKCGYKSYECTTCMQQYNKINVTAFPETLELVSYKEANKICATCENVIDRGYTRNDQIHCLKCVKNLHWTQPKNENRYSLCCTRPEGALFVTISDIHPKLDEVIHSPTVCSAKLEKSTVSNRCCDLCRSPVSHNYRSCKNCDFDVCNHCTLSMACLQLPFHNNEQFYIHTSDGAFFPEKYGTIEAISNIINHSDAILYTYLASTGFMFYNEVEHEYFDEIREQICEGFGLAFKLNYYGGMLKKCKQYEELQRIILSNETSSEKIQLINELANDEQFRVWINSKINHSRHIIDVLSMDPATFGEFLANRYTRINLCRMKEMFADKTEFKNLRKRIDYTTAIDQGGYNVAKYAAERIQKEPIWNMAKPIETFEMECTWCKTQCNNYYTNLASSPTIYCLKCIRHFTWANCEFKRII